MQNRLNFRPSHSTVYHLILLAALFFLTRIFFLFSPAGQLGDADQAVFGMMAQKIAVLEEFPIFCWEAHYAGAPVAYIAAIIFKLFEAGFLQLRIAMMLIIFPAFFLFYFIYVRLFDCQRASVGVLFLLFSPYIVFNTTMAAYGGYGESFLGTALVILLSWKIRDQSIGIHNGTAFFFLGLICGFFLYIQFYMIPAILAFAVPTLCLGDNRSRTFFQFGLGGFIGISPLIFHNILYGGGTFTRAAGNALLIGRDDIVALPMDVISNICLQKSKYLINWTSNAPLIFGQLITPDICGSTIQITAGLILIIICSGYIASCFRQTTKKYTTYQLHRQFAFYIIFFLILILAASLHSVRHIVPLFFVLPVVFLSLIGNTLKLKKASFLILIILSAFQVTGWIKEFNSPRFDPIPVISAMERNGIKYFYSSYWTGYPIMFLGKGNLIGSPVLLPFNEPFSDRKPHFTEQVKDSLDSAFVFRSNENRLEKEFLSFLDNQGISNETMEVAGTVIYFNLSKPVGAYFKKENWNTYFYLK